jgi:hypothetical protein
MPYRFEWSDWRDGGGIRLPYRLRRVTLSEPVSHEKFTIPAIVRAQDEAGRRIVTGWTQRRRAAGLPYEEYTRIQHVDMAPLAPGVWLARGGTHNSLVVEMGDHLVVFEPPLFEARSEEVIAAAKKSAAGKPIRHIVLSHFHDDHMGGVRTYAAEGAIVVASRVHELIQENGLSVEMIACAHGNAMPYAQFAYVLGK